jgi:hypothetical protein
MVIQWNSSSGEENTLHRHNKYLLRETPTPVLFKLAGTMYHNMSAVVSNAQLLHLHGHGIRSKIVLSRVTVRDSKWVSEP